MNSTDTYRDSAGRAAGAVNWVGDVTTLPTDQLMARESNLAQYVCAMLAGSQDNKPNKAEADRALALWVATRDAFLR